MTKQPVDLVKPPITTAKQAVNPVIWSESQQVTLVTRQ